MNIETTTYTLPAHWASALVNGDYSGMSDDEEAQVNEWLDQHPELGPCMGTETDAPPEFQRGNAWNNLAGDVLVFLFPCLPWPADPGIIF